VVKKQKAIDQVKIVVDTNIVFSGILNASSKIGKLLINPSGQFQYYSCNFLKVEIARHRAKILRLTKLTDAQLSELERIVTANITFINEELLPEKLLIKTEKLLAEIDPDDTPFVAMTKHLGAKLWTGDMELYKGLRAKRFKDVVTTAELSTLLDELEEA
jgi:predicted nucleic acid-binding protein